MKTNKARLARFPNPTILPCLLAGLVSCAVWAAEQQPDRERKSGEAGEQAPKREKEMGERKAERESGVRKEGRGEGGGSKEGQRDGARAKRPINAILFKVQSPSVLLVGIGDALKEMQVPIEPDTEILLQGERVKVSDLKPDMQLLIEQEAGLTRRIQARLPRNRGAADGEVRRKGQPDAPRLREGERPAGREGDRKPAEGEGERAN